MNVVDIEESVQELVSKGFKPDSFILDFVKAYDAPKALIQQLKGGHQNLSDVEGAVLWRRNLHYKLAPKGKVPAVISELERSQATGKYKARFVISTDGKDFSARDLISGNTINCHFDELAVHFASFLSLAGIFIDEAIEENPIDIKATKRLTKFYDSILQDNPTWKTDEMRHTLNHFITQVIFCLFAEDTGIITENLFSDTVRTYCESESDQAQPVITAIFTAMAHPEGADERSGLPGYALKFPHVNGGLFRGNPQVPRFLKGSVRYLMDAGSLDWKEINPDIFGSMIQAIVHQDQRGELGMHYTSVSNIMKLLKPLFLNDLQEQVQASWNSKKGLQAVLQRLMKIRVFDPACGSGNFLVIAYRELRNIEIQVIRRLSEIADFNAGVWSHVELKNFFGIEYIDFAAETAKLSLWIAEYQMNKRYEDEFGKLPPSLPLKDTNNIRHGNALRVAWESVCPHSDDPEVETYIVGNPPYVGRKHRTRAQTEDMDAALAHYKISHGNLDYVYAWVLKAISFIKSNEIFSYVMTNSIAQGEQVGLAWKALSTKNAEIVFAHKAFKWSNLAKTNAGVTCVIVGYSKKSSSFRKKFLYDRDLVKETKYISPYLTATQNEAVNKRSKPLSSIPEMNFGSMLNDGGFLILSPIEKSMLLEEYPNALKYVRRIYGGQEFLKGVERYCLLIEDQFLAEASEIPFIENRLDEVKRSRSESNREATRLFANRPNQFVEMRHFDKDKIILPQISSERREWFAAGYLNHRDIIIAPSTALFVNEKYFFSLISSKLHMTWIRTVCGQLETRIRYSNTLGWNTFPVPDLTETDKAALTKCAEGILLARDHYFEHTIAELYDPNHMEKKFPELLAAHQRNDEVLETIYNGKPFENDTERLEHLFARYVEMTSKSKGKIKGVNK